MSEICHKLHKLARARPRFRFPFASEALPPNGVYLLFEKNERAHGVDRIVRVGTHNGNAQLRSRMAEHFTTENKDRSIFRKNIGRAILNKRKDPFLEYWEKDLTSREARRSAKGQYIQRQKAIEREVTACIRRNFSFMVIPVKSKANRLELESKLISTIAECEDCMQSKNWLGNYSTKPKIRQSGLWQEQHLSGVPLPESDFAKVLELVRTGRI